MSEQVGRIDLPPQIRLCLWCEHCKVDFGEPDLSEVTPGEDPEALCRLGHWCIMQEGSVTTQIRQAFKTAETCPDYELAKEIQNQEKK